MTDFSKLLDAVDALPNDDSKIEVSVPMHITEFDVAKDFEINKAEFITQINKPDAVITNIIPVNPIVVVASPSGLNIRSSPEINTTNKIAEIPGNTKFLIDSEVKNGFQRVEAWVSQKYFTTYVPGKTITNPIVTIPPVVSKPVAGLHSKIGMHLYPPVGSEILQFLRDMNTAGRPIPGVLLLKPSTISIQDIKTASPSTKVMARPYIGTDGQINPNNWVGVTRQGGLDWFNNHTRGAIQADWGDLKYADYIQPIINEPGYDAKGTANFWMGMMDGAKGWFALGMLDFGVGYPDLDTFWQTREMKELAARAVNEPAIGNKYHVFAVHQYTDPRIKAPRSWDNLYTSLRHKKIMQIDPVYKQVHWVFNEFGDEKMPEYGPKYFIQQVEMADNVLKQDDNVEFAALWTFISNDYDPKRNWGTDNLNVFLPDLATYYKR